MKKIGPFMLAFFCWNCQARAQPTFMTIFHGAGTAQANLNELSSGNLLVGLAYQSGTSLMSPEGTLLGTHCYAIDTFLVLQSVKKHLDNDFYFVGGYWKDLCSITGAHRSYPVIGRMDSLGNILAKQHYELNADDCSNMAGDLEVMSDGGVVAWGVRDYRFFALRVDAAGEPLWARRFSRKAAFQFVKELPGGDLLAGINMDTAGAVVARLDAAGNFLWCKSYIRQGMVHDCVIESDDSFLITGYTDSLSSTNGLAPRPPDFKPKLFMMRLNGSGEVSWCKGYDSTPNIWYSHSISHIVQVQNGGYAILANLGDPTYDRWHRPFLMKTDQNGDTLWTRSVGTSGYQYETNSLLAYSDGGLIYSGRIWGELPEDQFNFAYLFKANAEGHLPCEELHYPVEVVDLFPTDSSFTLTSVDGAVARPAFISDVTYPPITQYNGCMTTTVPETAQTRRTRVYPNPTPGRFTVEFQDPLMKDSYYSVYDAMGKLLFQRAAAHGKKTEEVDLTGYSKGTYVIRFTDKEGTCYERVVLE